VAVIIDVGIEVVAVGMGVETSIKAVVASIGAIVASVEAAAVGVKATVVESTKLELILLGLGLAASSIGVALLLEATGKGAIGELLALDTI